MEKRNKVGPVELMVLVGGGTLIATPIFGHPHQPRPDQADSGAADKAALRHWLAGCMADKRLRDRIDRLAQ